MNIRPQYFFSALCLLFVLFSGSIYVQPLLSPSEPSSKQAGQGKLVWQKYNCQSCHQLYGLGGYLGPDLTNVISEKGKGETWVKAVVRAGNSQMPSFDLSEQEEQDLIQFLSAANRSGTADPRAQEIDAMGMLK